ncbi:unnamed protein product [Blepharisma stoltei]|uniref:Uncharacterized protein n=1 Tax=Blepharisma stoltei TaxID=1481888 RepID=A0AAU9K307_9CILI|nr:unnamed protein product [Blepharisma stoltei]
MRHLLTPQVGLPTWAGEPTGDLLFFKKINRKFIVNFFLKLKKIHIRKQISLFADFWTLPPKCGIFFRVWKGDFTCGALLISHVESSFHTRKKFHT